MIVVTALLVVLGGGLLATFLTGQASFVTSEAYIQVQQEARRAFDNMVRELREAGGAGFPIVGGGGSQLDFQIALGYNLAAPCPANQVCWGAQDQNGTNQSGWRVRYRLDNAAGQLLRETLNGGGAVQGTARVLANYVNGVTFAWDAASRVVTINLQLRYASGRIAGGSQQMGNPTPLTTRVRLRNP
ncbi:MAG: hypothetical protein COV75_05870 [Candidatus Omnitrophica bacterium CG11_big_fil_rev_8_21_14_0_20_63_9]|nr:MAG: hypothetical protein COV75_05870 [Candidatus Omnitrophica bacterium CG11_big_fil_rev_8_21_14_0_20_63_9]